MTTLHLFLLLAGLVPEVQEKPAEERLTVEALEARLESEARAGFSGAVLLVRDGNVVHEGAVGLANRELGLRCTKETVFEIGPASAEFTRAGTLLLVQERLLALEDPLEKFFERVPDDKRAITVEQLLTGRSGLPDSHLATAELQGVVLDRDEAVRRILAQELVFAPGAGEASSSSAWTLLAAVIEVVAGQPFVEFVRTSLLEPAGLRDTRFVGAPVPAERLALGYPREPDGRRRSAREAASWRVLGHGGMVSTTGDLWRWVQALDDGKVLAPDLLARHFDAERLALPAGAPTGFAITFRPNPDTMLILISNASTSGQHEALARELSLLLAGHGS